MPLTLYKPIEFDGSVNEYPAPGGKEVFVTVHERPYLYPGLTGIIEYRFPAGFVVRDAQGPDMHTFTRTLLRSTLHKARQRILSESELKEIAKQQLRYPLLPIGKANGIYLHLEVAEPRVL